MTGACLGEEGGMKMIDASFIFNNTEKMTCKKEKKNGKMKKEIASFKWSRVS
jgi:hypothetical protein